MIVCVYIYIYIFFFKLDIHVWKKCWILIMVQVVRETQAISQLKSLKVRGKLKDDGFGGSIILKYSLSM